MLFSLYFATMFTSSLSDPNDSPGSFEYHHPYRVAVYTNLFTGTIYGEGKETRRHSSNFQAIASWYDHRFLYRCLPYFGLRPLVSFAFEGKSNACLW